MYESREDSYLILKHLKDYAKGSILDIGTGSGILAVEASKYGNVTASDIDKEAIAFCRRNIRLKIKFLVSDLFSKIKDKFDLIIFNPPYLPNEPMAKDIALDGGKKGYELLERFFSQANDYMKTKGRILIVFSSLTNKGKVDDIIKENLFQFKLLDEQKLFFERLFVYLIEKNEHLKFLDKKNIKKIKKFSKGHRGIIYTGFFGKKKLAIKIQRDDIYAKNTVNNEIEKLKLLNKLHIGPKLIDYADNLMIYEFVEGKLILDYFN